MTVGIDLNRDTSTALAASNLVPGAWVRAADGRIKASGWEPREQGRAALDFDTGSVTAYEDA